MDTDNIAFITPHGSMLYGLNHENSDYDQYVVYNDDRPAKQRIFGHVDLTTVGIYTLLEKAHSGSHQALEAVFSPHKLWYDDSFRPYISQLVIPSAQVADKYRRTIKKFSYGDYKRRRHAIRLTLNLQDMRSYGRFNPSLTDTEVTYVSMFAETTTGDDLWNELNFV